MWTCPTCNKTFKTASHYHSCYSLKINDHLKGKHEKIQEIVMLLLDYCKQASKYELNVVKTGIMVRVNANFLSIYPTKNKVSIEFQLPYITDIFPVAFSKRIS